MFSLINMVKIGLLPLKMMSYLIRISLNVILATDITYTDGTNRNISTIRSMQEKGNYEI